MSDLPDDKFRPEAILDPYREEIARLRADVAKLREALLPVVINRSYDAKILDYQERGVFGIQPLNKGAISVVIDMDDLRRAARVMEDTKG